MVSMIQLINNIWKITKSRHIKILISKLLTLKPLVLVEYHGLTLYYAIYSLYDFIVEKRVEKVFKPKPGDVVIDIGAFLGRYTLLASKAVKNSGLVIAVEPNPLALKVLIKNIRVNGLHNIKVIRSACWSQNNILLSFDIISSYLPYGTASLVKVLSRDRINVKTSTLDSLMSHLGLRKVDWIKIDVEGAEYEVLKGAIKTLTLNRDIKVIVEVHEKNLKNPLCSFLRNLGFNIKWLDPYHLIAYRAYVQDSLTSE